MKACWGQTVGRCAALTAVLLATATIAESATKPQQPGGDEAAIRASAAAYQKAFNAADAKALAAAWTPDGELIDAQGRTFQGRAAIEKEFETTFAKHADAKIDVDVESVRFVTPNVAVENGTTRTRSGDGPAGPPFQYTAVHVKQGDNWLLASVTESRPGQVTSSQRLAGLAWMVGSWEAELPDGKTYRLDCEWVLDDQFLRRQFSVNQGDTRLSAGTQVVGWDPLTEQVVSWTFDSTGGIGREQWSDHGSSWQISAASTMPNGSTSLSMNVMVKLNDDAFTWKSVDRSLNGQPLRDTNEVRVHRVSK